MNNWLEITLNFIKEDINCNQYGLVNGKSTLSNILESSHYINEYLIEENYVYIIHGAFNKFSDFLV